MHQETTDTQTLHQQADYKQVCAVSNPAADDS
jgi:hypothetical protein